MFRDFDRLPIKGSQPLIANRDKISGSRSSPPRLTETIQSAFTLVICFLETKVLTMDIRRYSLDSSPTSPSDHPTEFPDPKRRRIAPPFQLDGQSSEAASIDLTETEEMSEISKTQAKQRADAILAQQSLENNAESIFAAYKCPVCMDTPVDATSTVCGMALDSSVNSRLAGANAYNSI